MRDNFPVGIRVIAILLGIAIFGTFGAVEFYYIFVKQEVPNIGWIIIVSVILMAAAIFLPIIFKRKLLIVLLVFSSLTTISSIVMSGANAPLLEAYQMALDYLPSAEKEEKRDKTTYIVQEPEGIRLDEEGYRDRVRNYRHLNNSNAYVAFEREVLERVVRVDEYFQDPQVSYKVNKEVKRIVDEKGDAHPDSSANYKLSYIYDQHFYNISFDYYSNGLYGYARGKIYNGNFFYDEKRHYYTLYQYAYYDDSGYFDRFEYAIYVQKPGDPDQMYRYQRIYQYTYKL